MATRRIFIAIVPPENIKNSLRKSIRLYKKKSWGKDVRWVKPDNLHLTLKFIGQIESSHLDEIYTVIESSIKGLKSFSIEMDGLKLFPKPFRPQIISAGIVDNPELNELASRTETSLSRLGIQKEKKKFKGHITLGRCKKSFPDSQKINNKIKKILFIVNEIIIFRSNLRPNGPEYIIEKKVCIR